MIKHRIISGKLVQFSVNAHEDNCKTNTATAIAFALAMQISVILP